MKKIIGLAALCLLASSFVPSYAQKPPTAIDRKTAQSPTNADYFRTMAKDYESSPTTEKRNRLINLAVSEIDLNFRDYQRKRRYGRDGFHLLMDILAIGASTAVNIVGGERDRTIIAEAVTLIQGVRASADKNLRLLELQILFNKMIEKRAVILTDILQKQALPDSQYPFDRAYVDIVAYFTAGTMDSALSSLATDTGEKAEDAIANLRDAKRNAGIKIVPTASEVASAAANIAKISTMLQAYRDQQAVIDAENAKAAPVGATIMTAQTNQRNVLAKLRTVFFLIEGDSNLGPLLNQLPQKAGAMASAVENSLTRLKDPAPNETFGDYEIVLTRVGSIVSERMANDGSLNERLKNILDTF